MSVRETAPPASASLGGGADAPTPAEEPATPAKAVLDLLRIQLYPDGSTLTTPEITDWLHARGVAITSPHVQAALDDLLQQERILKEGSGYRAKQLPAPPTDAGGGAMPPCPPEKAVTITEASPAGTGRPCVTAADAADMWTWRYPPEAVACPLESRPDLEAEAAWINDYLDAEEGWEWMNSEEGRVWMDAEDARH